MDRSWALVKFSQVKLVGWGVSGAGRGGVLALVLISPGQRLLLRLRLHFPPNFAASQLGKAPPSRSRPTAPPLGTAPPLTGLRSSLGHSFLHFSRLPHSLVLDAPRRQQVSAHSSTAPCVGAVTSPRTGSVTSKHPNVELIKVSTKFGRGDLSS